MFFLINIWFVFLIYVIFCLLSRGHNSINVMRDFFFFFLRPGPELVVVFVQGSGAKRCWLINMQAELPSLRCWLLHKSAPHTYTQHKSAHTSTQMQLSPSDKLAVHRCICRRTHAQCYESTGVQKYSAHTHTPMRTHTYTHIDLQLPASV